MKIRNLSVGTLLNKKEQKSIQGGRFGYPCSPEGWTCTSNFDCCGYDEDPVYGYPTGSDLRCANNICVLT